MWTDTGKLKAMAAVNNSKIKELSEVLNLYTQAILIYLLITLSKYLNKDWKQKNL